jgi:hypothetical protein
LHLIKQKESIYEKWRSVHNDFKRDRDTETERQADKQFEKLTTFKLTTTTKTRMIKTFRSMTKT